MSTEQEIDPREPNSPFNMGRKRPKVFDLWFFIFMAVFGFNLITGQIELALIVLLFGMAWAQINLTSLNQWIGREELFQMLKGSTMALNEELTGMLRATVPDFEEKLQAHGQKRRKELEDILKQLTDDE